MAQEMALKEVANGELRCLLTRNQSCARADVSGGDSVSFYESVGRKSAPKWLGPAVCAHVDETSAAENFQRQTPNASRHCAQKRMDP